MSERKEQAIYDAVHEAIMQLRIVLQQARAVTDGLDTMIAVAGHEAGMAAIAAYKKPLSRKKR